MNKGLWLAVAGLLILHHDFWLWDNDYLVAGVLPIGLAYHVGLSLVITLTWAVLTLKCWPADLTQE
jgi:hypothetical protein